ncbi:hypothetical protein ES332_D11G256400v1 [Gossypium tomentosum]|uniref:EH domain-containing protein n=1 Tax=Gossypium tomentosum TaxID=34277 RepID=A0A5D2IRV3_GOSTO|nr:hypothetical protein ES332_D11G256400v1 [Gossypium tomentosum]
MEGLDTLIMRKKQSSKSSSLEGNGSSSNQTSPASQWFSSKSSKKISLSSVTSIIDGLKRLYLQKLKPLEVTYHFNDFVSPLLKNSDFDAKPMVMLLGQYSTRKTTFIKHLLKTSYLGAHIGLEPTTNRFVVFMVLLAGVYKELRQAWRMPKSKLYRSPKIPRYHLKMSLGKKVCGMHTSLENLFCFRTWI